MHNKIKIEEKLFSNIEFSKSYNFNKKVIKYKFNNIIEPPKRETECLCFFNFLSGLSKMDNFFSIILKFKNIIKLNEKIIEIKKIFHFLF